METPLTILQSGDSLTLLTIFTVSDIISCFYTELIRGEGLQPLKRGRIVT